MMIETINLTFQYRKNEQIFEFPNITLEANENLLILGKSGIGKTTLLHLLAGLLKPLQGKIVVGDVDIQALSISELDNFRGQHIGFVFQKNHAVQSLSVLENLEARLFFSKKTVDSFRINALLEHLDLMSCKNNKVHQISSGQLQRLGIALSVVHNPQLILADEPTSSLDDENCKNVIELLIHQATKTSASLVVITHDQRIKSFFNKTLVL